MKKRLILALLLIPALCWGDKKVSELDDLADPTNDDIMYIIDDPSGAGADRKVTISTLVTEFTAASGDEWGDAVDADIVPDTDDTYDLGDATHQFKDGYFDGTLEADAITEGGVAVYNATEADLVYEPIVTEGSLANDTIMEADLKSVNAATDEYCLTYEATTGDFEWQTCGVGSGDYWYDAVDSDILPTGADDTYDLGSVAASFDDAHIQGTAYIGSLSTATDSAFLGNNVFSNGSTQGGIITLTEDSDYASQ